MAGTTRGSPPNLLMQPKNAGGGAVLRPPLPADGGQWNEGSHKVVCS
jgi:hypothetical protein